jgi:hypothetical protein
MLLELMKVVFFSALPISLIAYLVISRAILSNRLGDFSDNKSLKSAMKEMSQKHKEEKKAKTDNKGTSHLLVNKWLNFGGGFYGLMALITYAVIEIKEIFGFFINLFDLNWSQVWRSVSIRMLVDLFVAAIMNLVDAFVWFKYWDRQIDMKNGWLWLIAAYLGFLLGARIAKKYPMKFSFKKAFLRNSQ